MTRVVIRADASLEIGSGHVMRCLTLADELRLRGAEVSFITREHSGRLVTLIEKNDYKVACLQKPEHEYVVRSADVVHAALLGVSWEQDAAETIAVLGGIQPELLIVDHYAIDHRWEEKLRPHVGKIMAIDDLADRTHNCELLLDQNLYQAKEIRYENLVPDNCIKLLGPKYALLRPEFAAVRKNLRHRDGHVRRVLIFFGGVDATNETAKTICALAGIPARLFDVDVVVGGGNVHKEEIQSLCSENPGFHYHCQVDNMAELLTMADLAIGAGGTATWERCAVGVPSLVASIAHNQKELAETGARKGLFFYLGEADKITPEVLRGVLNFTLSVPETLQHYSENCLKAVDEKGVGRVANVLLPPRITLRRASIEDCEAVYLWRNAEETRQYIFSDDPIPFEVHREWFSRAIENPNRVLLIGEIDGKPVGVLRYDLSGSEALISIYLVPGSQGQGVGSHLIKCGSQWMRENYPFIRAINAEIFRENIASLRAFEAADFKDHHLVFKETL